MFSKLAVFSSKLSAKTFLIPYLPCSEHFKFHLEHFFCFILTYFQPFGVVSEAFLSPFIASALLFKNNLIFFFCLQNRACRKKGSKLQNLWDCIKWLLLLLLQASNDSFYRFISTSRVITYKEVCFLLPLCTTSPQLSSDIQALDEAFMPLFEVNGTSVLVNLSESLLLFSERWNCSVFSFLYVCEHAGVIFVYLLLLQRIKQLTKEKKYINQTILKWTVDSTRAHRSVYRSAFLFPCGSAVCKLLLTASSSTRKVQKRNNDSQWVGMLL